MSKEEVNLEDAARRFRELGEHIINSANIIAGSLLSVKKRLEEDNDWTKHDDLVVLEDLVIKANYSSWEAAKKYLNKEYPYNTPFFILTENAAALTLEEGEQLRDYLIEKIAYLKGE